MQCWQYRWPHLVSREHVVYHLAILLVFTTCEGFLLGALSANANTLNRCTSHTNIAGPHWPIIEHYSGQILVCLEQESPVRPKKVWKPLAKYDTRKQQVSSWILNLILHLQIPSLTELELEAVEIGRGEESPSEKKIFLKRKLSRSIYLPVLSDFHTIFLTILFRSGCQWGSWFWHKRKASWRERCRWAASYWSRTRNTSSFHSFHIGEHLCFLLHFKSSYKTLIKG